MPDQKPYEQHRRDGTWPPLVYIDVLPGDTRGGCIKSLVRYTPTGDVIAVVEFPDGSREPHRIDAAVWRAAELEAEGVTDDE